MEIKRDAYLNELVVRMHSGMIKVITGIRRCGKSYLVFTLFKNYLRSIGVDESHIIEVVLDDDEFDELRDPKLLSRYLKDRIANETEQYYVLLDEVQYAISREELCDPDNPPRLYSVLNGLLRRRNVDIYVTGSNSKLLSTDVMTEFRGRGDEVRVRPLSFAEFMQAFDGDRYQGFEEYLLYGGMPLAALMDSPERKSAYLKGLFEETYIKDVVARYDVRKRDELEELVNTLASSVGSLTNPTRLEATFKSEAHSDISKQTIDAYISYLKEAFLLNEARRFDIRGRRYIASPKKYYFADVGLRNARLGFRQVERGHLMENIVYNELCTRGYSVDVGVVEKQMRQDGRKIRKQLEVDFVANMGSRRYYIQSAWMIPDEEKRAQEKASLLAVPDSFKKVLLVGGISPVYYDNDGVLTMGVLDFLMDPASLDR